MAQIKKPIDESTSANSDGQDQQGRDFPPLREKIHSSQKRWDLIQTEIARHQDVLAELADA